MCLLFSTVIYGCACFPILDADVSVFHHYERQISLLFCTSRGVWVFCSPLPGAICQLFFTASNQCVFSSLSETDVCFVFHGQGRTGMLQFIDDISSVFYFCIRTDHSSDCHGLDSLGTFF